MFTGFSLKKLVILTLAVVFAFGLTLVVYQGGADGFDEQIQELVFSQGREGLMANMYIFLAHLGDWYVYVAVCIVLLVIKDTRFAYGFPLSFVSILSVVTHKIIKRVLMRPRPDQALFLITEPSKYSYPSGHTLASALFFGMLIKLIIYYANNDGASLKFYAGPHPTKLYIRQSNKILAAVLLCLFMAYMIGFARIYVGVHWPTDVIGSWLISAAILAMM